MAEASVALKTDMSSQDELNKLLKSVMVKSSRLETYSLEVLMDYDKLYRTAHNQFSAERMASNGAMEGLEEFYKLVNILRRNRDVAASIQRGLKNLRSLNGFKFIEENIENAIKSNKKERSKKKRNTQSSTASIFESDEGSQG